MGNNPVSLVGPSGFSLLLRGQPVSPIKQPNPTGGTADGSGPTRTEKYARDVLRAILHANVYEFFREYPSAILPGYPTARTGENALLPELRVRKPSETRPSPINIPDIAAEFFGDFGQALKPSHINEEAERRFRESHPPSIEPSPAAVQGLRRLISLPVRTPVRLGLRVLDDVAGGTEQRFTVFSAVRVVTEVSAARFFGYDLAAGDIPAAPESSGVLLATLEPLQTALRPPALPMPSARRVTSTQPPPDPNKQLFTARPTGPFRAGLLAIPQVPGKSQTDLGVDP